MPKATPIVSLRSRSGETVEMVFRPEVGETRLLTVVDGQAEEHIEVTVDGRVYVPYSPSNNLLTHRVLILPTAVVSYDSDAALLALVRAFIQSSFQRDRLSSASSVSCGRMATRRMRFQT